MEALTEAVSDNDWSEISRIAHKIKPSIDYLAAKNLQASVREVESFSDGGDAQKVTKFISHIQALIAALEAL